MSIRSRKTSTPTGRWVEDPPAAPARGPVADLAHSTIGGAVAIALIVVAAVVIVGAFGASVAVGVATTAVVLTIGALVVRGRYGLAGAVFVAALAVIAVLASAPGA